MSTTTRQPKGIPVGGQFAATTHADPSVQLQQLNRLEEVFSFSPGTRVMAGNEFGIISEAGKDRNGNLAINLDGGGSLKRHLPAPAFGWYGCEGVVLDQNEDRPVGEFNAQILDQVPDALISWASTDGPRNSGEVRFEPLDDTRTGVSIHIEWEPETLKEKIGAVLRADDLQVSVDLEKFKKFIEHRGRETGTWRGAVSDGAVEAGPPAGPPAGTG